MSDSKHHSLCLGSQGVLVSDRQTTATGRQRHILGTKCGDKEEQMIAMEDGRKQAVEPAGLLGLSWAI